MNKKQKGEWSQILVGHLPEEFKTEDLTKAAKAADAALGIKRTMSGYQNMRSRIFEILKTSTGCIFSKDNAVLWSCLIVDRKQLLKDFGVEVPEIPAVAAEKTTAKFIPELSREEAAFTIMFKIYRSAVLRGKSVARIPFSEVIELTRMEEKSSGRKYYYNAETIREALPIVKAYEVVFDGEPDLSGMTVEIPNPAIGLFNLCLTGEKLFPYRKKFRDFQKACDKQYPEAKEAVLEWTKKIEAEKKTDLEKPVTTTTIEEDHEPEFIKLFTTTVPNSDRQIVAKISAEEQLTKIQKSTIKKLSSDGIYMISVGEGWRSELEIIKFLMSQMGSGDEVYQNRFTSELYQKAQALEAYALAKISEEFEKRGL